MVTSYPNETMNQYQNQTSEDGDTVKGRDDWMEAQQDKLMAQIQKWLIEI